MCDIGQAFREHGVDDILDEVHHVSHAEAHIGLGHRVRLDVGGYLGVAGFRIGEDAYDGLFIVRGAVDTLGFGILAGRDVGKSSFDLLQYLLRVDVADDDHGLQIRTVPGLVELHELFSREGFQVFLGADNVAVFKFGALVEGFPGLLHHAPVGGAAGTPLFDDHAALLVDLNRIVGHERSIVVDGQQGGVDDALPGDGDVGEHVNGILLARGSIDIAAEAGADAFHITDDAFTREVLGSVEAHMLLEVGQTVLGRRFLDGSDVVEKIELCTLCGQVVVHNVVGHPIVELAVQQVGIPLQGSVRINLPECGESREQHGCKQYKSFHIN